MSTPIEPLNPAGPIPFGAPPPSPGLAFLVFWLILGLALLMFFPRVSPLQLWRTHKLSFVVTALGVVNAALWIATMVALGGDAVNSPQEGGRYFVRDHSFVWEVSHAAYTFSLYHTIFTNLTIPFLVFAIRSLNKPANENSG
jgi:branched-subunit amino acid transport protein